MGNFGSGYFVALFVVVVVVSLPFFISIFYCLSTRIRLTFSPGFFSPVLVLPAFPEQSLNTPNTIDFFILGIMFPSLLVYIFQDINTSVIIS